MQDRQENADSSDPYAPNRWSAWDVPATDETDDEAAPPVAAEAIFDPAPESANEGAAVDDEAFEALLGVLRRLPGPCAPPIGEGAFDILYASAREIVVWFVSAKDGVAQKEVAIPARLARETWRLILRGEPVDEAALRAIAAGAAGARWLLALFAQLPSIEVRSAAQDEGGADAVVTLLWRGA